MSTINVIENIKNETGSKLTPAQIAYELKKASAGLTEEKIEQLKAEKPLTADEKKKQWLLSVISLRLKKVIIQCLNCLID